MLPKYDEATTIEAVESIIQYKFKTATLLWEALQTELSRNRRLAIIGDAVLALALAEDWYRGITSRGKSHNAKKFYI